MRLVKHWMVSHGEMLAFSKTEVVVLTKKRIPSIISVRVGDEVVESKPAVKYLAVMINSKLSFFEHIRYTVDKAVQVVMALIANLGGPKSTSSRLLIAVVQSVLLYAAEL